MPVSFYEWILVNITEQKTTCLIDYSILITLIYAVQCGHSFRSKKILSNTVIFSSIMLAHWSTKYYKKCFVILKFRTKKTSLEYYVQHVLVLRSISMWNGLEFAWTDEFQWFFELCVIINDDRLTLSKVFTYVFLKQCNVCRYTDSDTQYY